MKSTVKAKCGKCEGRGTLSWTRNANGVCFQCNGAGYFEVDQEQVAAKMMSRTESIARIKRCLDEIAASNDTSSDRDYQLAYLIALTSDVDVVERAIKAALRLNVINIERMVESAKTMIVTRILAIRKVA